MSKSVRGASRCRAVRWSFAWSTSSTLVFADRSIARFTSTISSSWWKACVGDTADTEQNSRSVCSASTASAHGIPPNES